MAESYRYQKYNEDNTMTDCPQDDKDGAVTGKYIINLPKWFDENPEERKRLGWVKHIYPDREAIQYNRQTQFLITTTKQIDEWTVTDEYKVMDKSDEQLAFEEMLSVASWGEDGFVFF